MSSTAACSLGLRRGFCGSRPKSRADLAQYSENFVRSAENSVASPGSASDQALTSLLGKPAAVRQSVVLISVVTARNSSESANSVKARHQTPFAPAKAGARSHGSPPLDSRFRGNERNLQSGLGLRRLVEILAQVCANAGQRGDGEVGQRKFPPRDLFIDVDVCRRRLQDHVLRNFGDWIDVGIATRRHPAPDEILVERIGRRASGKARGVGLGEPIAAAVWRVDLVGENDGCPGVEPELIFGIDQDQPVPRGYLAAAGEQGQRLFRNLAPLSLGEELARDNFFGAQRRIVRALL